MPNTARELLDYTRSLFPPGPSAKNKDYLVQQAKARDKKNRDALKAQFDKVVGNVESTPNVPMLPSPGLPPVAEPSFSLADRVGRTLGRVLGGDPIGGIDEAINYRDIKRGEAAQYNQTLYDQWLERQSKVGDINESRSAANKNRRTTILDAVDKAGQLPSDLSIEQEAAEVTDQHQQTRFRPTQLAGTLAQQMAAAEASLAQGRSADRANQPKVMSPEEKALLSNQADYYGMGALLRQQQAANAYGTGQFQNMIVEGTEEEMHRQALVNAAKARLNELKAYLAVVGINPELDYWRGGRTQDERAELSKAAPHIKVVSQIVELEQQIEKLGTTKSFEEFLALFKKVQDALGVKLVGREQNPLMQLMNQSGSLPAAPQGQP